MAGLIYAMLAITLLAIIFAIVMFVKRTGSRGSINAGQYDVFEVSGNQLTVLAGIPVTYDIGEIDRITFSASKAPRSMSSYNGIMRIVKADGKKSRPFLFNSSALTKKMVLASSKREIEETIQYLMEDLKRHHIACSRVI